VASPNSGTLVAAPRKKIKGTSLVVTGFTVLDTENGGIESWWYIVLGLRRWVTSLLLGGRTLKKLI